VLSISTKHKGFAETAFAIELAVTEKSLSAICIGRKWCSLSFFVFALLLAFP
jgi:hypothetical protein